MRSLVDLMIALNVIAIERMIDPLFIVPMILLSLKGKYEVYYSTLAVTLLPFWVLFCIIPYIGLSADTYHTSGKICNQAPLGLMKLGWCWSKENGFNPYGWKSFDWDMVSLGGGGGQ